MGSHDHLIDTHGQTPYHMAIEYLIRAGADTEVLNKRAKTCECSERYRSGNGRNALDADYDA